MYLITYSQADLDIVPTRKEFSRIVLDTFSNANPPSRVEVVQWVCSQEGHRNGGIHYHMAVKLSARRRWLKGHNYLEERHGVKVNFSDKHCNYYSQLGKECVVGCNRRWLQMARNLLERDNIAGDEFSKAIRNLLDKGRGKYRKLYLKGPSNSGKTLLLNPLKNIYNTLQPDQHNLCMGRCRRGASFISK